MRSRVFSLVWLLLIGLSTLVTASAAPQNVAELDKELGEAVKRLGIPGASVAIIENGELTLATGYGLADLAGKVPASADTPFRAGSISKSLTAIAVMTLVEQGKLSLDAPLSTLVADMHMVNPWEKTDPVRLVNLLEHTTGWPDISTKVLAKDEPTWSILQGLRFASPEFVSRWKPGYFPVYNNAGPGVAGYAIEKASGETFSAYLREQVLRPLGMQQADFELTPELNVKLAKSYAPDGSATPYQHIILKPAGSLNVSARELSQLVRFYLGQGRVDGREVLLPASVARIERAESTLAARVGFTNGYGLGNAPFPDAGISFRGHNGSIDSFTSVLGYSLRCGCGYVLMANGGEGVDFGTPIAKLVQTYLTRGLSFAPQPSVTIDPESLRAFAGFYQTITPANDLQRPYAEILGITHITTGPQKLIISGNDFHPTSAHAFRRFDREAATIAFVEQDGNLYKIGAFSAQQKISLSWVIVIGTVVACLALGALVGLALLIPWIRAAIRGRLSGRELAFRLLPLLAIIALIVTGVLPIMALMGSGTSAVHALADIGPYSLALLLCSVLYPLAAVLGLALAWRSRTAPRIIRWYVGLTCTALLCVSLYAVHIHWLPMRSWIL